MELSDAHLLEALKLLPAAEQRSFDVCLAAASMTQAAMRAAVEAGIETRQEAARAAALRGKPFAKCRLERGGSAA